MGFGGIRGKWLLQRLETAATQRGHGTGEALEGGFGGVLGGLLVLFPAIDDLGEVEEAFDMVTGDVLLVLFGFWLLFGDDVRYDLREEGGTLLWCHGPDVLPDEVHVVEYETGEELAYFCCDFVWCAFLASTGFLTLCIHNISFQLLVISFQLFRFGDEWRLRW